MIDKLTAGDTLNFLTSGGDYPAGSGWSLVYKLIPRTAGPSVISFSSSAEGDDHRVTVASTTTANWTAGTYSWAVYASRSGERHTLQTGTTQIMADPGAVSTLDTRSPAAIALEAADAALAAYGAKAYLHSYEIAGRSQRFQDPATFMAWRDKLKAEVRREEAAADIAAGRRPRNQILARFNTR
ncbi:MAG: hypothetical protein RL375_748 [Pseudomonadota bacterium]|jgi:hypothetical protein